MSTVAKQEYEKLPKINSSIKEIDEKSIDCVVSLIENKSV